ncbi:WXG100 family type VII secretion target [Streptomyces sp. NPDC005483]|uniref:WXG100 family type VII secretion target n=1 Tax=Streptomyces sp. NPDC005483 TaxID=3154882 RepID=UPI0033B0174D
MAQAMGGIVYDVTPTYVSDAATDTANTADQVAVQLADLRTYVVSLETAWGGVAADQFQILMQEYDKNAKLLHEALTAISLGLRTTAANYRDAEEVAVANVGAVNIPPARLG